MKFSFFLFFFYTSTGLNDWLGGMLSQRGAQLWHALLLLPADCQMSARRGVKRASPRIDVSLGSAQLLLLSFTQRGFVR